MSASTASFVASIATLTLAATVLGAGALGDKYGMRRMYTLGLVELKSSSVSSPPRHPTPQCWYSPVPQSVSRSHYSWDCRSHRQCGLSARAARDRDLTASRGVASRWRVPLPAVGSLLAARKSAGARHLSRRPRGGAHRARAAAAVRAGTSRRPPARCRRTAAGRHRTARDGLRSLAPASRVHATAIICIVAGLVTGAAFVAFELRTADPALDMRIFRSGAFGRAALFAGVSNFLTGGTTILLAFYLVTIRDEPATLLGLLMAPACCRRSPAAGRVATVGWSRRARGGDAAVAGRAGADDARQAQSMWVFAAVAFNSIGSAVSETIEATIMLKPLPSS